MIERNDFLKALREDVKAAFGQAEDALKNAVRRGIIDYGPTWAVLNRRATELPARLRNSRLPIFSVLIHGPPSSGKTALAAHMAIESGFPFVKFVSNPPLTGYGELQKCNILRRAFDDSYKSPLSVIVLDDIERLIEFSALGGRYSNTILQALLVLIKNPPPDGRKLLVIGTTSNRAALQDLELTGVFSSEIEAPTLGGEALDPLTKGLRCKWHSPKELSLAAASMPAAMPLKTLIQVIEVAAEAPEGAGVEEERVVTYERFSDALMLVGNGM
jgi:vesicle-fusing ATPase